VKVTLDAERCCGYGDCVLLAPEIFEMGDAVAYVRQASVPDALVSAARSASDACPVAAISLSADK
jgi:ferredoxin